MKSVRLLPVFLLASLLLIPLLPHPADAQDSLGVTGIGSIYDSWIDFGEMVCFDSVLYVPTGDRIRAFNVSDPAHPIPILEDHPSLQIACENMIRVDTLAICSIQLFGSDAIRVFDLGDVNDVHTVGTGTANYIGNPDRFLYMNGFVHIMDGSDHWTIFDLQDPAHPSLEFQMEFEDASSSDLAVYADHAYISSFGQDILIYDVTTPATPVQVGTIDLDEENEAYEYLSVMDHYLLFRHYSGLTEVFDLMPDPANPSLIGSFNFNGPGSGSWTIPSVTMFGTIGLIPHQPYGLAAVDFSDMTAPTVLGWFYDHIGDFLCRVGDTDTFALGSRWSEQFGLYDASQIAESVLTTVREIPSRWLVDATSSGEYIYCATTHGIATVHGYPINMLEEVSFIETEYEPEFIEISGGYLCVTSDYDDFVHLFRLDDPTLPEYLWSFEVYSGHGDQAAFAISHNRLAFYSDNRTVQMYDLSDATPSNPPVMIAESEGFASSFRFTRAAFVNGTTLVLHEQDYLESEYAVVSIRPPSTPQILFTGDIDRQNEPGLQKMVTGNKLRAFGMYEDYTEITFTNPSDPLIRHYTVDFDQLPYNPTHIEPCNGRYVAMNGGEIMVFDLLESTASRGIRFVESFEGGDDYSATDEALLVIDNGQLKVYSFLAQPNSVAGDAGGTLPSHSSMVACYPNPFNAATVVTIRVAGSAPVTLSAYNILGQQVGLLHQGVLSPGAHSIPFEADGLTSGTYFLRLQQGSQSDTRRVTLTR